MQNILELHFSITTDEKAAIQEGPTSSSNLNMLVLNSYKT